MSTSPSKELTAADLSAAKRALLEKRLQGRGAKAARSETIPRLPAGQPAPLSFSQQRLWFLHQLQPDSAAYHIANAFRMEGKLELTVLEASLNEILRRHESLRVAIRLEGADPVQVVRPYEPLALPLIDLRSLADEEQERRIAQLIEEEARRPFDLSSDPLMRATLLRQGEEQFLLLLTVHHIAADGWSLGVFTRELRALYEALLVGEPPALPELPVQYPDYAAWQRQWLTGKRLQQQLDYWREQLAGLPPVLELPTDRPRPALPSGRGERYPLYLPEALTDRLKELARQENVTLFMLLLAALKVLLFRYSRQEDIAVGTPIANRQRPEIEGLIGLFVNTLVLRSQLSGRSTVRELLARIREVTLEAYAHQDLPFERLVEELRPERTLSYTPLFQVQFVLQNAPMTELALPGVTLQSAPVRKGFAKFDLTLSLIESEAGLGGTLEYNVDLFDAPTIARLATHFVTVLHAMVLDPDQSLAELSLLSQEERQQMLVRWNDTARAYPIVEGVHRLFEQQVERRPDAVALRFEGESLTYRELNQRANQLAHHLRARGVGPEIPVGLFMDRSLDLVVGLLAILKAGGAYVPADPVSPADRLAFMFGDAGVRLVLTRSTLQEAVQEFEGEIICLDREWANLQKQDDRNLACEIEPHNLAYLLFTSGSTGRPKGVAVEHRQLLNYLHGIMERVDFPPEASYALVSTFAADLGNTVIFPALCGGGTLHIISYERAADPEAFAEYCASHPIDCLKIVPSHFEVLLGVSHPERVVPHRRLIFGGEASRPDVVERVRRLRPDCTVMNHYGPTETTVGVLTYLPDAGEPAYPSATLPLGRPLPNSRVYLLDEAMQPVPVGVPGELFIGGAGVTRGYHGRPGLTTERFIPDPFSDQPGARLYRTGDLARYLPDGNLEFLGRTDHQVKIRGYRIELGEIEALLYEHPAVREALVIVREDQPGDKRLVAYLVRQEGGEEGSVAAMRGYLREHLPDYMIPTAFVWLEALPLTPNGKIDRRALPLPDASLPEREKGFVAPRTALEQQIAAIWSEVLGVEQVGIEDNFFDLGGESFKAIRVTRQIGEGISVMALFKYPTVRELAASLEQGATGGEGELLHELSGPARAGQRTRTLVCIPYGGGSAMSYGPLAAALPPDYRLYAVELPGHDFNRPEEPLQSLEEVARRCVEEIKRKVVGGLELYGHCVGSALTIEIARLLEAEQIEVERVYLAASFPSPRPPGKFFELYLKIFSRDRFIADRVYQDFLKSLGGFEEEVEADQLAQMMRTMRHDFNQAEDYFTGFFEGKRDDKLRAPIVCLVGEKDRATEYYEERIAEWRRFSDNVRLAVVKGAGHFFLKQQPVAIARVITGAGLPAGTTRPLSSEGARQPGAPAPSLRAFFLVAIGQLLSMLGTGLTAFALGVWVYQQTGSVSQFALISLWALLPGILTLPIAGALVDRWDRRWVMIMADSVASLRTLALAFLLGQGVLELWHIYIAAGVGSICGAFQRPAYAAAIAQLVPKRYLGHANGLAQLGIAASNALAPLLGGILVAFFQLSGVILVDFATFLVGIGTLLAVRFPNTLFRRREEPLVQEILNGWRYIITRPGMVAMVLFFATSNFLMALMGVLITPLVLSFSSVTTLGVISAVGGSGMLIGSLAMGAWGGTARRAEGMVAFVGLEGLFIILMGLYPSPVLFAAGLFGFFLCLALSNGHWQALIQTKVDLDLQGRVFSTNQMVAWSMMPLGYLLSGPLADNLFEPLMAPDGPLAHTVGTLIGVGPGRGMALMMVLAGLLTLLVGVIGYRYPRLRFMEDELPDGALGETEETGEVLLLEPLAEPG